METDPLLQKLVHLSIVKCLKVSVLVTILALSGSIRSLAGENGAALPDWLRAHVGEGDGQIAPVVLQRARALYLKKFSDGIATNPCYLAMDATLPSSSGKKLGRRFYVICEGKRSFRAVSSGHGGGRNLRGVANFRNGIRCARHFSNAMESRLTTGGAYLTAEAITSFKGYYRTSAKHDKPFLRTFVQFDGEGDTSNARPREIGGHPAMFLRVICRKKNPKSPHADENGYVPFGKLVSYAGGRSSGCTSWTAAASKIIIPIVKNKPTTLYIYPEARDIAAVVKARKAHRSLARDGLYWNTSCLKQIGTPKFWPKEKLEPMIVKYTRDHPERQPLPKPICKR